ncbi:MAG: bifunctional UDP-N-acetylmuramoyl-tripeptide:D-alanyl-D-alanine ligase/alanine racemase [Saprospiraceae bacterium]|nr:bifunctional UDP-N-acetylmuramoyl-tripeptide:D-alanyl-D-alanine ligase/alanine racemase [Saprospiraceae bacterium]
MSTYEPDPRETICIQNLVHDQVSYLVMDSRNILYPAQTIFIAIRGNLHDGHDFVPMAYAQGVRNFLVSHKSAVGDLTDINYILTHDPVNTLQKMAAGHRAFFPGLRVIGITGSNGKTIVKEWLSVMLSKKFRVIKTPLSYNSQIGVPLSVWQINDEHEVGVFEAGISTIGEMEKLESIIKPEIGILTNLGDAHDSGFRSIDEKIREKLLLFKNAEVLIYNGDTDFVAGHVKTCGYGFKKLSWGRGSDNAFRILKDEVNGREHKLQLLADGVKLDVSFTIGKHLFFENLMHCLVTAVYMGLPLASIESALSSFDNPEMRLKLSEGRNGCVVVDDSYTNDRQALSVALDFMHKHAGHRRKIVVLSEMEHNNEAATGEVRRLLQRFSPDAVFWVGPGWQQQPDAFSSSSFTHTEDLLEHFKREEPEDAIILIKGARRFRFERVYEWLVRQSHSVSLDIDLGAIAQNLSAFGSLLNNETQLMPIIKASAYGAGSEEIAKLLQYKGVYALGVAFADEGAQLRKAGITIPIVVLNADPESFQTIFDYNLDLEIYSLSHLDQFFDFRNGLLKKLRIHLKLDTGMSRLGFREEDMASLTTRLRLHKPDVGSIFTHLSSTKDSGDDDFSHLQVSRFQERFETITNELGYRPRRHVLNSSGIIRFPSYHFELVRLGIGLYGIDSTGLLTDRLEKVHTLKARIIQIKKLKPGDFIGYNRRHAVKSDTTIGVLNIGYADGFIRKCGNGRFHVLVNGKFAPVVGNVCMDLSMIDITGMDYIREGDEVVLFGKHHPIETMAEACETIPYEILCRIAPRIKRNYLQ